MVESPSWTATTPRLKRADLDVGLDPDLDGEVGSGPGFGLDERESERGSLMRGSPRASGGPEGV
jgi:hypothetical protein